ncbi:hypothetical protein PILCRDRAFT_134411 [Piloderma croceum F 1598]|uniref:Uncharacterized protein n=1 Tax=Piloderma croceum (strain F 1598) TaxID=765440 RepID=A0A0C3GM77_PILCF|nr:hypothetical protein PILCRDRAFT_134411 [Piloderma croceum F 1598]
MHVTDYRYVCGPISTIVSAVVNAMGILASVVCSGVDGNVNRRWNARRAITAVGKVHLSLREQLKHISHLDMFHLHRIGLSQSHGLFTSFKKTVFTIFQIRLCRTLNKLPRCNAYSISISPGKRSPENTSNLISFLSLGRQITKIRR